MHIHDSNEMTEVGEKQCKAMNEVKKVYKIGEPWREHLDSYEYKGMAATHDRKNAKMFVKLSLV